MPRTALKRNYQRERVQHDVRIYGRYYVVKHYRDAAPHPAVDEPCGLGLEDVVRCVIYLTDFADYNAFLDVADAMIETLGLVGVLQVASFHPAYQFAGTTPDDVTNYTNRSPYPMLHLLREASIDRAVAVGPKARKIYQQNIETMRRLGIKGWMALGVGAPKDPEPEGSPCRLPR